jgi:hypothetical protein
MFDMKIVGYQTIEFFPSVRNPSTGVTGAPGRLPGQPESPSNGSVSKGVVTPTVSPKEARFYVSRLRVLLNVEIC